MCPLRSFEQHGLSSLDRLIDQHGGIDDMALQPIGIAHILLEYFVDIETFHLIQLLEKPIDLDQILFEFGSKSLRIQQIPHADTDPRHLVGIGRADPSPRRSDSARPFRLFRRFVDGLVIRQDQMRALTHDKVLSDLHALGSGDGPSPRSMRLGSTTTPFPMTQSVPR